MIYKTIRSRFVVFLFKFPCLHSSIFLLRANRQVNLLHFDLKLLSVLVLLPIPVRTISREKEMAFLYCSSSKEAKIEPWISSDLLIHHWQPIIMSKRVLMLWWPSSARQTASKSWSSKMRIANSELPQLTIAPSLRLCATSRCSRATDSFSLRKEEKHVNSSSFLTGGENEARPCRGGIPAHRWGNPPGSPALLAMVLCNM